MIRIGFNEIITHVGEHLRLFVGKDEVDNPKDAKNEIVTLSGAKIALDGWLELQMLHEDGHKTVRWISPDVGDEAIHLYVV